MNTNNPKVKVISVEEAGKMDKNNVAYFTLNDGTVAIVKKDDQKSFYGTSRSKWYYY